MSRGKSPIVKADTKKRLEKYYVSQFPIMEVWRSADSIRNRYDSWHRERASEIANAIKSQINHPNKAVAVSAKFLDTFMYQLMKHEWARPLWPALHLPLDARVFKALREMKEPTLKPAIHLLNGSPYILTYEQHQKIQETLLALLQTLAKDRTTDKVSLTSRIELNLLWL